MIILPSRSWIMWPWKSVWGDDLRAMPMSVSLFWPRSLDWLGSCRPSWARSGFHLPVKRLVSQARTSWVLGKFRRQKPPSHWRYCDSEAGTDNSLRRQRLPSWARGLLSIKANPFSTQSSKREKAPHQVALLGHHQARNAACQDQYLWCTFEREGRELCQES